MSKVLFNKDGALFLAHKVEELSLEEAQKLAAHLEEDLHQVKGFIDRCLTSVEAAPAEQSAAQPEVPAAPVEQPVEQAAPMEQPAPAAPVEAAPAPVEQPAPAPEAPAQPEQPGTPALDLSQAPAAPEAPVQPDLNALPPLQ